jgi:3-methyladenine DNA glycosylase AlkD
MNARDAAALGQQIARLVLGQQPRQAYAALAPVLDGRMRFPLLERIGEPMGACPPELVYAFLDRIAAAGTIGGWVVIGKALGALPKAERARAFDRCRLYMATADVWVAADTLGERVPGAALVSDFEQALRLLHPWQADANAWVRRATGVATHLWTKRSRGAPEQRPQAVKLLSLLEPLFEEQDEDAIKGIGWGLKTLGKYYPDLAADWLARQLGECARRPKALMLRKAVTYLSPRERARVLAAGAGR